MDQKPALSIIVPIYNVEKYLEKCLRSLAEQDYRDFEVIMIDDGSPDWSARIAKRFAKQDRRFHYIYQENAGLGAARNEGLARSRADLIMWTDSDDVLLQGCLSKAVPMMLSGEDDFVTFGVYRYSERSQRLQHSKLHHFVHREDLFHVSPLDCQHIFRDSTAWNKIFRKSFFQEHVGGWEEGVLYEDLFPMCRAVAAAKSISVISDKYYIWRSRAAKTSITQQRSDIKGLEDRFLAITSIAKHLNSHSKEFRQRFLDKFFTVDYPIYMSLVGKGDREYDRIFAEKLQTFLDVLDLDVSLSPSATPEQKLLCKNVAAMDATQLSQMLLSDVMHSMRNTYGERRMNVVCDHDQVAYPEYQPCQAEYPDVFKVQAVDLSEEGILLRYSLTSLPNNDPVPETMDHAIVIELLKSGYRQLLKPTQIQAVESFFGDQIIQIFEVSIPFQSLLADEMATDFYYGRHWRKKVFSITALKSPDVNIRHQAITYRQPKRLQRVEHPAFSSVAFHIKDELGFCCTLRRKQSASRLAGQAKERISRAFVF